MADSPDYSLGHQYLWYGRTRNAHPIAAPWTDPRWRAPQLFRVRDRVSALDTVHAWAESRLEASQVSCRCQIPYTSSVIVFHVIPRVLRYLVLFIAM